jgi:hypothetical protein
LTQQQSDAMGAIGASFGIGASVGGGIGEGADDMAAVASGRMRRPHRPAMPFNLPPGLLTATSVGSFLDLPQQFGPPSGWFWDITSISVTGFTAGAIAVTRNAPAVTAAGGASAIEPIAAFAAAGTVNFPQKGMPLLDGSERLVFCVTGALTGTAQVSGAVIAVPAERISEYLGL